MISTDACTDCFNITARQMEAGRRIRITGQRYFKMDWSFFFSPR